MQVRKLVKSGHASLVIAVPRDWIKANKLKAGDLVYLDEENDHLRLSSKFKAEKAEKKEIVINVDGKQDLTIMFEITSAYLNSYDQIIIKGKDLPKRLACVKETIRNHVALELMDESSEHIIAKDFLNFHDIDLKLLARRMDNIVRSMISDTKEALKDPGIVDNIVNRDTEVNRINFLIFKILKAAYLNKGIMRSLGLGEMDVLRYWDLNVNIEKIGDRVKNIASIVPDIKPQRKKAFLELFTKIEEVYLEVMKSFYQNNLTKADAVALKRNEVMEAIHRYNQRGKSTICSQIAINTFTMAGNINDIARIVRYLN